MTVRTLTFDFVGVFSSDQPILSIWYGGQKIYTSYASISSQSATIEIDTDESFNHNDLRFYFQDKDAEAGRSIAISNIKIDGADLDLGNLDGQDYTENAGTITLDQHGFTDYDTSTEIPEVLEPDINGTGTNDKIFGSNDDETFNGLGGDDSIRGFGGDDTINGGAGNDVLVGGDGEDSLYGGLDNDKLYGGNDDDRLEGGDGNDRLEGEAGNDTLYGGAGNDVLIGGEGDDFVYGEDGDDYIVGGGGSRDELYGGDGRDKIYGGDGDDRLDGGDGNDIIAGYAGDDNIYGGTGDDYMAGDEGNDTIYGEAGLDTIYGDSGSDTIRGGDDDDRLFGNSDNDIVYGDEGNDFIAGGDDNDNVYGGNGNDVVIGEDGNDRVEGNDGDDVLVGGLGNDVILGGNGADTIYGGGIDGYDVTLAKMDDADLFFDHASQSIYKVITTTANFSNAASFAATQTINGVAGHLLAIESVAENDFITTEMGLRGITETWLAASDSATEGTWVWTAGQTQDTTFFSGGSAVNSAYNNFGGEHTTGAQDALVMNSSGVWHDNQANHHKTYIIEWNYDDLGNDNAANTLLGGAGNDTIYGSIGNEQIKGEDGDDIIYGGAGRDTISGNDGDDVLYGGVGDDLIVGGNGSDVVFGGDGADRIVFESGEFVDGGAGFDTAILSSYESGAVDISNFTSIGSIALDNYKGAAAANTLTISYADVATITGGNTLYISADLGLDIVTVTDLDTVSHYAGTSVVNGVYYEQYSNAGTNIFLEAGLVTANQAFVLDPVTVNTIANDVDINTGSYLAKTTGLSFQTGADVNTTQMLYEQGGTSRGLNIFIEGGKIYMAAWNYNEENWGYKEVSADITANTRYTASMVFDGVFPSNGTLEGFLNDASIGSVGGVGNLYAHSGAIGIGEVADNTVVHDSSHTATSPFTGIIQKAAQYNAAYSGTQLDGFHDFLATGWVGDVGSNTDPEAVDDTAATVSGGSIQVDVLTNDTDADFDVLTVNGVGSASNGTVVLNGDNTVTYTADLGFTGTDTFTYTVFDGLATDTATVTITVDPLDTIADPTEITGLNGWLDMGDAASHIDGNADGVLDGIDDKSANNLDATQGTASAQPNVVTIDGKQWVEFDGNDMLAMADSDFINTGGPFDGKTISISFMTGSDVNTRQVIYEQGGGTRGLNFFVDGGNIYINGWNRAETQWGPTNVSGSLAADTAYVATLVYDGVAGTFSGYLNGTLLGTVGGLDLLYAHADDTGIGGINGGTYFFTNGSGGTNFTGHIGEIAFYDNAIADADRAALDQYMVDKWVTAPPSAPPAPASAPEILIAGDDQNEVLRGEGDNDLINAAGGNDYVYGGEGDDTINGEAGKDFLYGEAGNDTLLYGEGYDYLYGGEGADTFKAYETDGQDNDMAFAMDFDTAEGDRLDISNLLDGFDSDIHDITDFVNVAQGNHTTIQIDRDGAGTEHGWDNVIRLQGNTTLDTDVEQLITDGTLII